jgi:hypothetical protein
MGGAGDAGEQQKERDGLHKRFQWSGRRATPALG